MSSQNEWEALLYQNNLEFFGSPQLLTDTPLDEKLDKSDAAMVDVIHTDAAKDGFAASAGHADFYIGNSLENLGKSQAGCEGIDGCDHQTSVG